MPNYIFEHELEDSSEINLKRNKESENKIIILNMDGTLNDETDEFHTNIKKMHDSLQGIEGQVSLYFGGPGNESDFNLGERLLGGVFGSGADQIRMRAYVELFKNFTEGDKIIITGFSRGAAIARMIAQDIHENGIPEQLTGVKDPDREYIKYLNYKGDIIKPDIECLVCLDTVASFGIPMDIGPIPFQSINLFKDFTVSPAVKKAYHAVSLDEDRESFTPTLMNQDGRVEEVWFSGVHADVGGGYEDARLADVVFHYMSKTLSKHGAHINGEYCPAPNPLVKGDIHYHEDWFFQSKREPRDVFVQIDNERTDIAPVVHGTVFNKIKNEKDYKPESLSKIDWNIQRFTLESRDKEATLSS